ncbi:M24 family metallopeptidase [Planctomicrobium sp. SH527]|uniref:M24 family metallopeptidase n=1 Tax=Planctomicrobium sp. SH527 TaxID=3448123 RepID=UPI003F5C2463
MASSEIHLDLNLCRERQQRLASVLVERNLEMAVLVRAEHVQYFTAFRPAPVHQAVVVIDRDGRTTLAAPNKIPDWVAADDVRPFEAQWCCTLRQDQLTAAMAVLADTLTPSGSVSQIGVEGSTSPALHLRGDEGQRMGANRSGMVDIEPSLWTLRRKKDADELSLIRKAIDCTEAMYATAREIIEPGITELEVYNQLHATAVYVAGEPLTGFGNDFQSNSPGGSPRNRPAESGELFILDLGPAYRGYYADNCRTIAVNRQPSEEQMKVWTAVVGVLDFVEQTVKPGVSAKSLFLEAKRMLDDVVPCGFFHHLGHGIGLFPHETPHLNENWNDCFEVGDVFTAEPGVYSPALRAGMRLEQDYLVTESGVELLTSFTLDLA